MRCLNGCKPAANYIVYGIGFLCTECLAKLEALPPDHMASFELLARLLADLAEAYEKNTKQGTSILPLKAEAEQRSKQLKKMRDALTVDVKAINHKALEQAADAVDRCRV
jgi:hypothetical protein